MRKIGLHTIGGFGGKYGPSPVIKLADASPEFWGQVRSQVGANTLMIWRKVLANQPLDNPEQRAQEFFNQYRLQMIQCAGYGGRCAFSFYNEIAGDMAAPYAKAVFEFMRLMHLAGLPCCIIDSSVGTYELSTWPLFNGCFEAMRAGDYVGLHEYWVDTADIDNRWHCGRWTLVQELAGVQKVITECGRDIVEGKGKPGWQYTCSADVFIQDLVKYDKVLQASPNVAGATVFSAGDSLGGEFAAFRVDGIWPRVVGLMETSTLPEPPPVTPPPPPPPSSSGFEIDGRCLTQQQFRQHVKALKFTAGSFIPRRIFLHHTAVPDEITWRGKATIDAMHRTYDGWGWKAAPHLFVAPEGIWLFNPMDKYGRGIGEAPGTGDSWHVEMVANGNERLPVQMVLENTLFALAVMFRRMGLNWRDLWFHRDVSTSECPGNLVTREWFMPKLAVVMGLADGLPMEEVTDETIDNVALLVNKSRWWMEEWTRWYEAGHTGRAREIQLSLISLMYEAEQSAK